MLGSTCTRSARTRTPVMPEEEIDLVDEESRVLHKGAY